MNYINQFKDNFKFLTTEGGKIQTLKSQVVSTLNRLLPERVLSKANIFNISLDVVQDISSMLMYYIEDSLNESNILTAQHDSSIRGLADLTGHKATRPISSRGTIKITLLPGTQLLSPRLVFQDTVFISDRNIKYVLKTNKDFIEHPTNNSELILELIEGVYKTQQFTADGSKLYTVELNDPGVIENYEIEVYINSVKYSKYDNLYAMGADTEGYILNNGIESQVQLIFGDGVHGKLLEEGANIEIKYLVTNGELGNADTTVIFKLVSGLYDTEGSEIEANEYLKIEYNNGFDLGSNGENKELTRNLSGLNSRSLVFARPENLKAYLSRLSILSKVDAWTEEDDLLFNLLVLPRLYNRISTYNEYLTIDTEKLKLNSAEKESIINMINASRRQATSSEIIIHDPIFKRYCLFVYVTLNGADLARIKEDILNNISELMINETFEDVNYQESKIVPRSSIVNTISNVEGVAQTNINIISEENEVALNNGEYELIETSYVNGAKQTTSRIITLNDGENPNLGFSELGDINVSKRKEVPLLRGGFSKYNSGSPVLLDKPVYIFYKNTITNQYEEL